MRMHRERDVGRIGAHLDRERHLRDQVAGIGPHDPAAEQAMRRRIEQQLRQALVTAERK